jgi:hypothetical protein
MVKSAAAWARLLSLDTRTLVPIHRVDAHQNHAQQEPSEQADDINGR